MSSKAKLILLLALLCCKLSYGQERPLNGSTLRVTEETGYLYANGANKATSSKTIPTDDIAPGSEGQVLKIINGTVAWEEDSYKNLTDGNGTTFNGTTFDLGGTITSNATELLYEGDDDSYYYTELYAPNSWAGLFLDASATGSSASLGAGDNNDGGSITMKNDNAELKYNGTGSSTLTLSSTSNTFKDGIHYKGLTYAQDYSANFTDNSLITKKYVEDLMTGGFKVSNEANNRIITSTGTGTGNAESNLTFTQGQTNFHFENAIDLKYSGTTPISGFDFLAPNVAPTSFSRIRVGHSINQDSAGVIGYQKEDVDGSPRLIFFLQGNTNAFSIHPNRYNFLGLQGTHTRLSTINSLGDLNVLESGVGYLHNDGNGEFSWDNPIPDLSGTGTRLTTVNSAGVISSLSNGTDEQILRMNGSSLEWESVTFGDVVKVATPLNNQLAVWTGDGTLEGVSGLMWDGTKLYSPSKSLTLGGNGVSSVQIHTDGINVQKNIRLGNQINNNGDDGSYTLGLSVTTDAPSTSDSYIGHLYAKGTGTGGRAEIYAHDGLGNSTLISPHNFDKIPQGKSEEMAWAFYSERDGKYINVDMLKLVRLVEQLTGEKLVYTGDL